MSYSIPCTLVLALEEKETTFRISLYPSLDREVEISVTKDELSGKNKRDRNARLKVNILPFYERKDNGEVVVSINSISETGTPQHREFYIQRKYLIPDTPQP